MLCNACGGSMSAVSRTECIVHENVSHGSQLLGELGIVLLLSGIETGVLQQNSLTVLKCCSLSLGIGANGISSQLNGGAQQLGKTCGNGSQSVLGNDCALGLTHVRAKDNLCTLVHQILDGGESFDNSLVGSDLTVLERYVEVATNENSLAGNLYILNVLLVVGHFHVHLSKIYSFLFFVCTLADRDTIHHLTLYHMFFVCARAFVDFLTIK